MTPATRRGTLWIVGYLVVVGLPVALLLGRRGPGGLGFWWDFSMGLGFAGLAVMGAQFGLTARFRRASAPFGIDVIYYFHRWMGVGGLMFLMAHYAILRATAPEALAGLLPWNAPGYMTAGRLAFLAFAVVTVTSLWRKPLGIEYDRWRVLHALVAVAGMVLAIVHVLGVDYYSHTPWRRALWGGYVAVWLLLVGYVRLLKPWRLAGRPWRVTQVRPESPAAWTVRVEPEGHDGLAFQPGQFGWLTLGTSPFLAREHPFSFSSSARDTSGVEFTIKALGDFTRTVRDTEPGTVAFVDGPHGAFTVDRFPDAPGFSFVAGGVGIAPVVSMIRTLADRGDRRPLRLIYANDAWQDVLFADELERLAGVCDLTVTHVLLRPPEGWTGPTGFVTPDLVGRVLSTDAVGWMHFLCGPRPMSEAAVEGLRGLGVPRRRIHFELFDMV